MCQADAAITHMTEYDFVRASMNADGPSLTERPSPPEPSPPRLLLTVEESADRLGVGRTLMVALVAAREIESVKIGRLRRVPASALSEYVARLRTG